MASGIKNFLERNFTGILVTLGLAAVSSVVLHDKWEEEQARSQLLDKMAASDVTKLVCGLDKARPDLALTLAPLLEMEDRTTRKTGEDLLRHVTMHGISFAFCPLAQGTTSFEVVPDATGRHIYPS